MDHPTDDFGLPGGRHSGSLVVAFSVISLARLHIRRCRKSCEKFDRGPLSVISGFIALVKGRDGRQRRRGLSIAALWVAAGGIAACGAADGDGLVIGTVQTSPLLTTGECFNETPQSAAAGAEVGLGINYPLSCDQPHSDEVFAVLRLSHWPGIGDHDVLTNRCKAELQKYSPPASRDPNVAVVMLTPDTSWKYMNNHTSGCLAHFAADRVGSIKS
jgi:hypothetical protein